MRKSLLFQVEGTNSARGRPKITLVVVKTNISIKEVTKRMTSDNRDMDTGTGTSMVTRAIYEKYMTLVWHRYNTNPKEVFVFLGLILSNLLTKNSCSNYWPIMVLEHGNWKKIFLCLCLVVLLIGCYQMNFWVIW